MTKTKTSVIKAYKPTSPRKSVPVFAGKNEGEERRNFAALVTSPELAAYRVINGAENKTAIGEGIELSRLLREQCDELKAVK